MFISVKTASSNKGGGAAHIKPLSKATRQMHTASFASLLKIAIKRIIINRSDNQPICVYALQFHNNGFFKAVNRP
jgi:hypothetical protein